MSVPLPPFGRRYWQLFNENKQLIGRAWETIEPMVDEDLYGCDIGFLCYPDNSPTGRHVMTDGDLNG